MANSKDIAKSKSREALGVIPYQEVETKIAVIRNLPVIADADVAELYGVETRRINEAVRNNPDKFPADYMFDLSKSELQDLRSKISTTKVSTMSRTSTKVFTEKGLYMLATILHSPRATAVTFAIIDTFVQVRELKRELLELHQETDRSTPSLIRAQRVLRRRSRHPRWSILAKY